MDGLVTRLNMAETQNEVQKSDATCSGRRGPNLKYCRTDGPESTEINTTDSVIFSQGAAPSGWPSNTRNCVCVRVCKTGSGRCLMGRRHARVSRGTALVPQADVLRLEDLSVGHFATGDDVQLVHGLHHSPARREKRD